MEATAADIYVSSSCFYFATRKDEHAARKCGSANLFRNCGSASHGAIPSGFRIIKAATRKDFLKFFSPHFKSPSAKHLQFLHQNSTENTKILHQNSRLRLQKTLNFQAFSHPIRNIPMVQKRPILCKKIFVKRIFSYFWNTKH